MRTSYRVGDTVCEILLKNANNGTSAYDLMAGLFRICCLNSLVTQTGTIDSVKVRHSGDVNAKVIEEDLSRFGRGAEDLGRSGRLVDDEAGSRGAPGFRGGRARPSLRRCRRRR